MEYVLLIDDQDGTALIGCPDYATAERVASAAVFNDGGDVSAYRVPKYAITDVQKVIDTLSGGGNCEDILDLELPTEPRE